MGELLLVRGIFRNRKMNILIDTGATTNVIDISQVNENEMRDTCSMWLRVVGNHRVQPMGEISGTLRLGDATFDVTTIVISGCPQPMILGMEFLTRYCAKIDLEHKCLQLTNAGRRTILQTGPYSGAESSCHTCEPSTATVRITNDMLLRPGESRIVELSTEVGYDSAEQYTFYSNEELMWERGLVIGRALTAQHNKLWVRVKNMRHVPLGVFQQTSIGELRLVKPNPQYVCTNVFLTSDNNTTERKVDIKCSISAKLQKNERNEGQQSLSGNRNAFEIESSEVSFHNLDHQQEVMDQQTSDEISKNSSVAADQQREDEADMADISNQLKEDAGSGDSDEPLKTPITVVGPRQQAHRPTGRCNKVHLPHARTISAENIRNKHKSTQRNFKKRRKIGYVSKPVQIHRFDGPYGILKEKGKVELFANMIIRNRGTRGNVHLINGDASFRDHLHLLPETLPQ